MRALLFIICLFFCSNSFAQKKVLNHTDKEIWNRVANQSIAPDGNHVVYSIEKGERDHFLKLKSADGKTVFQYPRGERPRFTYDSDYVLFTIKEWKDSITEMKRRKVKKNKLPKDTLGIYNLKTKTLTKIAQIKSYKYPEEGSGYLAYTLEEIAKKKENKKDSTQKKKEKKKKAKKVGKDNGYHLVLRNLITKKQDTFKYVTQYSFAKKGKRLAFVTSGDEAKQKAGVYVVDLETGGAQAIYTAKKAKYFQLMLSETAANLAFVVDSDTTKIQRRPNMLYHWKAGNASAEKVMDNSMTPQGYKVSPDGNISFSKDESKLFFGLATPKVIKDTTLLKEEIVNVEVWTYDEPRLYTVQELQVKNDKKKSYQTVVHLNKNNKLVQLGTSQFPNVELTFDKNANYALVDNPEPYQLESQWDGLWARDYAMVDVSTGARSNILKKVAGRVNISPKGEFAFGYNRIDSTWFAYEFKNSSYRALSKDAVFYNELHDSPTPPNPYGSAGWTKNDEFLIVYDRYDLFKVDPRTGSMTRLTQGRENKKVYRYLRVDSDERELDLSKKWLLSSFDEQSKDAGYLELNPKNGRTKELLHSAHRYSRPVKAALDKRLLFRKESFVDYPDLYLATPDFKRITRMSAANPQQKDYNWGTIEQIKWTSLDGKELTGMLVKPENFDPTKKYPMIVNFYEKSSNGIHRHRAPTYGRSTINYAHYASNGYIIFNPDVYYRDGYPGESAYNCVIPGVTSLIEKGFVDKDNIGVQGHSWGGYQIAYLVTKTDIFKAAEAGAPVPNMISAYGGIRWWTGLSRMFQYEHTQSRIGGTPWQYPARYIENSPIFNLDKVNTPLLIMHNDADGHVPWYQGIELFVSLRRLGKPSWFLNYNDEPHWPLKYQNRKDFNIRLSQFFDHYLKGAAKPVWMDRGVPAIEKGIHQGLELMGDKD